MLALEPFAEHAFLGLAHNKPALPCECIGTSPSRVNVVYLHGLDTFGPSWTEMRNRDKLRAISRLLGARIALPRTRSSWLRSPATQIRAAAASCFPRGEPFVVVGFSDGANAVNQLFLDCRTDVATQYVSIGSSAGFEGRHEAGKTRCGTLTLIAGRHEPGLTTTRLLARQLGARFYEHPGPHELPFNETMAALRSQ